MNSEIVTAFVCVCVVAGLLILMLPIIGTGLGIAANNFFNELHECRPAN